MGIGEATLFDMSSIVVPPENFVGETGRYGFRFVFGGTSIDCWLPLPPQSIQQSEPSATSITPTMGGKIIERKGFVTYDLRLEGNFGFLPSSVLADEGSTALAAKNTVGIEKLVPGIRRQILSVVSGFKKFHDLRTAFRRYQDLFTPGVLESGAELDADACYCIWINPRDAETLIVEPMDFQLRRSKALQYQWSMQLAVIGRFNGEITNKYDPAAPFGNPTSKASAFDELKKAKDGLDKVINNFLDSTLNNPAFKTAQIAVRNAQRAIDGYTDEVNSIIDIATNSSLLGIVHNGVNIVASTIDALQATGNVPFEIADAAYKLARVSTSLAAQSIYWVPNYVDQFNTYKAKFADVAQDVVAAGEYTGKYFAEAQTKAGNSKIKTAGGGNDTTSMRQSLTSSGVSSAEVQAGETLPQFVSRVLGDVSLLPAVVLLNGLAPPYFSPSAKERWPRTLAPGDRALVPALGGTSSGEPNLATVSPPRSRRLLVSSMLSATQVELAGTKPLVGFGDPTGCYIVDSTGDFRIVTAFDDTTLTFDRAFAVTPVAVDLLVLTSDIESNRSQNGVEQSLGTDLLLLKTPEGDYDLVVDQNGSDVLTVSGIANYKQAMESRCRSEPGDYPAHPEIGLVGTEGKKATPDTLFTAEVNARLTFLSDPRTKGVESLAVQQTGDVQSIKATVVCITGVKHTVAQALR